MAKSKQDEIEQARAAVKARNTASTAEAAPPTTDVHDPNYKFGTRSAMMRVPIPVGGGPSKISRAGMGDPISIEPSPDAGSPAVGGPPTTTDVHDPNYKFGTRSAMMRVPIPVGGGPSKISRAGMGDPLPIKPSPDAGSPAVGSPAPSPLNVPPTNMPVNTGGETDPLKIKQGVASGLKNLSRRGALTGDLLKQARERVTGAGVSEDQFNTFMEKNRIQLKGSYFPYQKQKPATTGLGDYGSAAEFAADWGVGKDKKKPTNVVNTTIE